MPEKSWHQREEAKKRNRTASRGGAAENTGAESDPVGNSPAAPIAQDNTTASRTNLPADVRADNQKAGELQSSKPVTEATTIPHGFSGVPSREDQAKESEKVAADAPPAAPGGAPAHVMAASGDPSKRVAHSAPGGTITTKDGTFTHEEWAERQRAV